nr:DoxX family protein [uncultured Sphingomonas sp.]
MIEGRFGNQALGLLRIVAGLLFMLHGTSKLFGFPPFPMGDLPAVGTIFWFGAIIEAVGGLLILLGLFTRPAAFIASGQMAVAYWMFHAPKDLYPSNNGGDAAILFCFIFLLFAAVGPGAWSVDGARGRKIVLVDDELE